MFDKHPLGFPLTFILPKSLSCHPQMRGDMVQLAVCFLWHTLCCFLKPQRQLPEATCCGGHEVLFYGNKLSPSPLFIGSDKGSSTQGPHFQLSPLSPYKGKPKPVLFSSIIILPAGVNISNFNARNEELHGRQING